MMKPLIRSENTTNGKKDAMNEDNNTMIVRKIALTYVFTIDPNRLIRLYNLINELYETEVYEYQIDSDSDVDYTENEIDGYDPNEDDDNGISAG